MPPSAVPTRTSSTPPVSPSTAGSFERLLPGIWINHNPAWLPADHAFALVEDWDYTPDLDELIDPTPRKKLPFPDWHQAAECAQLDPDEAERTFFGSRDTTSRPAVSMKDIADAKKICAECPVYQTCLETALGVEGDFRNEYGIWAGTSGRTRKRIWGLVDDEGWSLTTIIADIMAGNLATYERSISLTPVGEVIPLRPVPQDEEEAA